ncbi:hypothetical protein ABZ235_29035 [Streptomyces canus]|uniref:hypothetical protein n=1 Tax=Streptomyces canus TaxID=58343 RepID=UPI0033ADA8C8
MSPAAVAIIVSGASAAFTLANMLISAATFRRGGPRVKLHVRFRASLKSPFLSVEDPTTWRGYLHVHVRNRSSVSVEVENVRIVPSTVLMVAFWPFIVNKEALNSYANLIFFPSTARFLQGEEKTKVEAWGGARWVLDEDVTTRARPEKWVARLLLFRVRITLTNGREIHSRPMLYLKARRLNTAVYQHLERVTAKQKREEAPTLDDALLELEREQKTQGSS